MLYRNKILFFRSGLLEWFDSNKRDFPWREDHVSNYELIVSEILLQRTNSETVSRYYRTFFDTYPSWDSMLEATIEDFEIIFKPLGLYRQRAQRLYKIIREYKKRNGFLPSNVNELHESNLATPYISNAYELFVLKQSAALLDVNMIRVLSRFYLKNELHAGKPNNQIRELAYNVIDIKNCKELNWAILDYGSKVCRARKPKCNECMLRFKCNYFSNKVK